MIDLRQYAPSPAGNVELCQFWSAHVDALEHHLSANTWALAAAAVVLAVYPIARVVIPAILHDIVIHDIVIHGIVPNAVRTVLHLI